MKTQLMAAITVATLVGGCAYAPPFADGIPQTSNECVETASMYGPDCGAQERAHYALEMEKRAVQYYANLRARQPSATASVPAPTARYSQARVLQPGSRGSVVEI